MTKVLLYGIDISKVYASQGCVVSWLYDRCLETDWSDELRCYRFSRQEVLALHAPSIKPSTRFPAHSTDCNTLPDDTIGSFNCLWVTSLVSASNENRLERCNEKINIIALNLDHIHDQSKN